MARKTYRAMVTSNSKGKMEAYNAIGWTNVEESIWLNKKAELDGTLSASGSVWYFVEVVYDDDTDEIVS